MNESGEIVRADPFALMYEAMPKKKGPWYQLPEDQVLKLEAMNRHERRAWLATHKQTLNPLVPMPEESILCHTHSDSCSHCS